MKYEEMDKERLAKALNQLEMELEKKEEEKEKWEEKAKRIKADFENYKKTEDDRKKMWKDEARKNLAEDLLDILDNLERAIASAEEDSNLVKGVKMVADQLYNQLEKRGLKKINAEGEEFDPKLHKAVETREHPEHNKVLEEKRKGYMYDEEILREAEVVVGESKEE